MVTEENCNEEEVTKFVKHHIPDASMIRKHGMELSYTLPMNDTDKFHGWCLIRCFSFQIGSFIVSA
jgi:hypothetical protein